MKFKSPISLNVLSPKSMYMSEDFLGMVRAYCELLPQVLPEKWGWTETEIDFDVNNLEELVLSPAIRMDKLKVRQSMPPELQARVPVDDKCQSVSWHRKKKPKAEGAFGVRWCSKSPLVRDIHSYLNLAVEFGQVKQELLVMWLKKISLHVNADIASMEVITPTYQDFAMRSGGAQSGVNFFFNTHILRHWLPDIFWGTVFGPPYVALFGKENLLSAPVFLAEQIGEDMIYIQLTEQISDVVNDPERIALRRKSFKKHIGVDAFFELGRSYDAYSRIEHGAFGTEYKTPKFELFED